MATDSPIGIGARKGVGGDHQICLRVVQMVSHGCDTHRDVPCLVSELVVPFNFGGQGDVVLLLYSPVYRRCVQLSAVEEEVLLLVVGSMRGFFGSGMERTRVDWAVPAICHKELGARDCKVDANEWSDVELPSWVRDEFEEPISRVFKVAEPLGTRQHSRLRPGVLYCFGYNLCFDGSEHMLQRRSQWMGWSECHVKVVGWRSWIGWWRDIARDWGRGCDRFTVRENG